MEVENTQTSDSDLKVLSWLYTNRKILILLAVAVAVIAMVAGIMAWQKSMANEEANAQLMNVPLLVLRGDRLVDASGNGLLEINKEHPDTSAGEYALILNAENLFTTGKYPEAQAEFSKFVDKYPASTLIAQAKIGVAASLEGQGKIPESIQQYQQILATYSTEANIVSPLKLTMARLEEGQNKPELALAYYEELARINNPRDPWVAEARERGQLLLMRHPELRKAAPGSPTNSAAAKLGTRPAGMPGFHLTNSPAATPVKP